MIGILEYAQRYPGWHNVTDDPETQAALWKLGATMRVGLRTQERGTDMLPLIVAFRHRS